MGAFEMIPFITGAGFIEQHRPRQGRLRHNRIGAGLVQSYRIKDANMPTFGTRGTSFSLWQSQ